jgi:uncharacterized phage protein (TIGR01671 family)
MREILFRGKRVDNGEWITGYYIKANHHWHNQGIHEDWIVVDTIQNGGWGNVRGKYAVIPETIGQFTGITDKNGKKIFEGDIVKYEKYATEISNNVYVVKYDTELATFIGEKYSQIHVTSFTTFENDSEFIEVIGNIHDNPELISN